MAIDFPASPTNGQIYQGYYYDSSKAAWRSQGTSHGSVITSATTPTGATAGDMWFNTVDGTLFIYYNDGISTNWVEVNSTSSLIGQEFDTRLDSLEATRTSILAGTTKLPGSVVQVQEYRGGVQTTTSGPPVDLINITFTTKFANSKLYLQYYTAQLSLNKVDTNPEIFFQVDGVDQGLDTDHIFYGAGSGWRPVATIPLLTGSVGAAGDHNVKVRGGAYNSGVIVYNYQAPNGNEPRRPRFLVMEVAQ
jgi:hypothetical protein